MAVMMKKAKTQEECLMSIMVLMMRRMILNMAMAVGMALSLKCNKSKTNNRITIAQLVLINLLNKTILMKTIVLKDSETHLQIKDKRE